MRFSVLQKQICRERLGCLHFVSLWNSPNFSDGWGLGGARPYPTRSAPRSRCQSDKPSQYFSPIGAYGLHNAIRCCWFVARRCVFRGYTAWPIIMQCSADQSFVRHHVCHAPCLSNEATIQGPLYSISLIRDLDRWWRDWRDIIWIRNWSHMIATHLLLLFLSRRLSFKSWRLRRFKSDRDDIRQYCSSSKYASISGVGFPIWGHYFQDGGHDVISPRKVMPSMSAHAASAGRPPLHMQLWPPTAH